MGVRRQDAIEAMLRRIEMPGIPQAFLPLALERTRQNAAQSQSDRQLGTEIQRRLGTQDVDDASISAEAVIQAQQRFVMFDALIRFAQSAPYHAAPRDQ
jgi:hypothetical protein